MIMKLGTGNQTRASNFALKSRQRYSYRCHCPLPAGLLSPPEQQKPRQQTHQWRFIFWSLWYLRCTADCTLDALAQSGRSKKSSIPRGSQTLLWDVGGWSPHSLMSRRREGAVYVGVNWADLLSGRTSSKLERKSTPAQRNPETYVLI